MVGLVAQDDAAGMVGDGGGDAHQSQADRPGLPPAGGGGGQGEHLGEGEDVAARATIRHQMRLAACPCRGKRSRPRGG